jgi:hypothetical protein
MQVPRFVARYIITPIDNRTYSIQDPYNRRFYFLLIDEAHGLNFNVQVIIVEVRAVSDQHLYVEFVQETFNLCWYVRDADETVRTVESIFGLLQRGTDISNPVELSSIYGAELLGSVVKWPAPNPGFIQ